MTIGSTRRTALRLTATAAVVFGGIAFAGTQEASQMLKEGVDLLMQGKTQEANAKFRAVLASDPSDQDAYQLVKETDYKVFLEMLKAGGDAEQAAKRLLTLSHSVEIERSKDPAAIKGLVDTAVGARDLDERDTAARKLAASHGQYAVPALVPYLGSNDVDTRANAVLALTRIGSDAVLPLAASIGTGNEMQTKNTIAILRRIGDERCEAAIAAATGDKAGAVQKYLAMGRKYLRGDPMTIKSFDRSYAVWTNQDGKLVSRDVPRFMYAGELAEQCGYDALALDPSNKDARALIALADFSEVAAWDNLPDDAKQDATIQAAGKSLDGVAALAAATGTAGLLDAFAMGADVGNGDAAAKVADAIPMVWDGREIGEDNVLVRALSNENATIRHAAAICLLRMNPAKPFPRSNMVASIAGEAAASRSTKQVLVVDTDSKNAMNVQRALNGAGFHAVAAGSGAEGLSMAKATGGFDAVVLAQKLDDMSSLAVLAELGRDFRTSAAKKIVMAPGADLGAAKGDFEKFGLAGVAPTSTDSVGVVKVCKEALTSPEGDSGRVRANKLSIAASNAIAGANAGTFPLHDAQTGLLKAAGEGADPDVALAALNALARLATADSQTALRGIVANASAPATHRVAACRALATALRGQAPAPETYTALLDAMGDADVSVRTAAGAALGSAKLTPAQTAEVMNKRRVN